MPHESTGLKGFQLQRWKVESALCLRIAGEKDLESTVEEEAVHLIGPNASANAVRRLKYRAADPRLLEPQSAAQARESRADNDDIICHYVVPPESKAVTSGRTEFSGDSTSRFVTSCR